MIYAEMKGRLGNQFFRYAFARWLQIERGNKDKLIFGFSNMKGKNPNEGWCDSLKDFNIQPYEISNHRLVYEYGSLTQKLFDTLFFLDLRVLARNQRFLRMKHAHKWLGLLNRNGLIHNVEEFYNYTLPNVKNIIVDGDFQNSKYFNSIRNDLLEEFTPRKPPLLENKNLYEIIERSNSVCISIRRGDFFKPEFIKTYNICDKRYFEKAVELIKHRIDNPVFVVFSDEIEWAKKNLNFGAEMYFERGIDPLWEKVRLMSLCKHFVISNSSFSWIVQYLGKYREKIVVSPDRWYNGNQYSNYLIEDEFLKIKV